MAPTPRRERAAAPHDLRLSVAGPPARDGIWVRVSHGARPPRLLRQQRPHNAPDGGPRRICFMPPRAGTCAAAPSPHLEFLTTLFENRPSSAPSRPTCRLRCPRVEGRRQGAFARLARERAAGARCLCGAAPSVQRSAPTATLLGRARLPARPPSSTCAAAAARTAWRLPQLCRLCCMPLLLVQQLAPPGPGDISPQKAWGGCRPQRLRREPVHVHCSGTRQCQDGERAGARAARQHVAVRAAGAGPRLLQAIKGCARAAVRFDSSRLQACNGTAGIQGSVA